MLEHLLVLCQRLLGGILQLLHLIIETIQQLLTHLLQLLSIFLRKVCRQLGDAALQGVDALLVQAHLLFQLVHHGSLRTHTAHILLQVGGHVHQLLEGLVVGGNLAVDGIHCLDTIVEFLGQLVKFIYLQLKVSHSGNGLGLLYLHLIVFSLESGYLAVKFFVKVILLDADIFLDLVQGTVVPVHIPECQRKNKRNTNRYEYSKDRHILFPTQKNLISV